MTDLHSQVLAKLAELRATAEAALADRESDWWWDTPESSAERHIATWNPAFALRWIAWAEDVAKRHTLWVDERGRQWCTGHADLERGYPCQDFAGLAHALGIQEGTT